MDIRRGLQIPVYIDCDPAETDACVLARAIKRAGYQPGRPVEP
jgi:hypothetical protein